MLEEGLLSVTLGAVDVAASHQVMIGTVTPGAWLVLTVADEGTGIADEILNRIFDPFFTTKDSNVGTGLGLSLALRIVTEIRGAIDVRWAADDRVRSCMRETVSSEFQGCPLKSRGNECDREWKRSGEYA